MTLHQRFAIFSAKMCLHLWKAPKKVIEWLSNPTQEKAHGAARTAGNAAHHTAIHTASHAAIAAQYAAQAVMFASQAAYSAAYSTDAVQAASIALNITVDELRQEFVSTWREEELSTTDPDWMNYATVEILNREVAVSTRLIY